MILIYSALMAERLMRMPRVQEVKNSNPNGQPNLIQHCKQFATALTSM